MPDQLFTFEHSGLGSENVDRKNAVIHGVSVITNGVTARGHNLEVDDKTLEQLLECAQNKGKVPVKYNHGSGVDSVGGYLFNFRIEGDKLKADWQLMESHDETPKTLERANKMPECFGLSAAFMGKEEDRGGKKFARCTELISVDCVAQPAANPDGLFSARVDRLMGNMSDHAQKTESQEDRIEKLLAAIESQNERINQLAAFNEELVNYFAEAEDGDEDEDEDDGDEDEDEEDVEVEDEGGEELSAVEQALVHLERKASDSLKREKNAQEEHAFAVIEAKIAELVELNEKLAVENQALATALTTANGQIAKTGVETKVRLFSADPNKDKWEARVTELMESGKKQTEAIELAMKEDPEAYTEHLVRIGSLSK